MSIMFVQSVASSVADYHRVETGNAGFAEDFSKWVFQETGVVKVISSTHHREGETEPRELYRIKDDLVSVLYWLLGYSLITIRRTP